MNSFCQERSAIVFRLSILVSTTISFLILFRVWTVVRRQSFSYLSVASFAVKVNTLDNWFKLRRVVDRMHNHTFDHALQCNRPKLLTPIGLWNSQVKSFLASLVRDCSDCKVSSIPPPNCRSPYYLSVDPSTMWYVLAIFFKEVTLFYIMGAAT